MSPVCIPCYQPSRHQSVYPVISHHVISPCSLLAAIMSPVRVPVISHVTSPCSLLSAIMSPVRVPCYQPSCHQSVSLVISHVTSPCPLLSAMSLVRVPHYQPSYHQSMSRYQPCHNCFHFTITFQSAAAMILLQS
jgi:hypothetical protein